MLVEHRINEHAQIVRADIAARLATLGVAPLESRTVTEDAVLVRGEIAVLRIEAREGRVIARETRALAAGGR